MSTPNTTNEKLNGLKECLTCLLAEIEDVVQHQMPKKGLIEEDCQRQCLLNSIMHLEANISGISAEDLIPNEYSYDCNDPTTFAWEDAS
jgi:hypothetical protein